MKRASALALLAVMVTASAARAGEPPEPIEVEEAPVVLRYNPPGAAVQTEPRQVPALSAMEGTADSIKPLHDLGRWPNPEYSQTQILRDIYTPPNDDPYLTPKEMEAIEIAREWRDPQGIGLGPVAGGNGTAEFVFGSQQPIVICAPLQLTDIELENGEKVHSVNIGDLQNWDISPALSNGNTAHVVVKPRTNGVSTSLLVTTDRRTYHFQLKSHSVEYMPRVKFVYPENALQKWAQIQEKEETEKKNNTLATGEYLGDLSFDYEVKGRAPWKPVRVFNNGEKTIIEMPSNVNASDLPILMLIETERGRFRKREVLTRVNSRYHKETNRFIVDAIFDEAKLVRGVGKNESAVRIKRIEKRERRVGDE